MRIEGQVIPQAQINRINVEPGFRAFINLAPGVQVLNQEGNPVDAPIVLEGGVHIERNANGVLQIAVDNMGEEALPPMDLE